MSFYLKTKGNKEASTWMSDYEREGCVLVWKGEVESKTNLFAYKTKQNINVYVGERGGKQRDRGRKTQTKCFTE